MAQGRHEAITLPATSFAILGMLTFGEMSGYDLVKAVEGSIGFFWTPAKSQIYLGLRRLVGAGCATEREIRQSDRPDKRLYRITAEGERAFRQWLEDTDLEPMSIKSPLLVKVFFGHQTDPEHSSLSWRPPGYAPSTSSLVFGGWRSSWRDVPRWPIRGTC